MTVRQTNLGYILQHFYLTVLLTIKYSKNILRSYSLEKVSKTLNFEINEYLTNLFNSFMPYIVIGFGEKMRSKMD